MKKCKIGAVVSFSIAMIGLFVQTVIVPHFFSTKLAVESTGWLVSSTAGAVSMVCLALTIFFLFADIYFAIPPD